LHIQHSHYNLFTFLCLICNIRILVHSKHFWFFSQWQLFNVLLNFFYWRVSGHKVDTWLWKWIVLYEDVVCVKTLKDVEEKSTVPVICNSAAVVDLTSHILHCIPWNFGRR
jgi:hypothetical protein